MTARIPDALRTYIEARILPRYDGFDAAHRRDHAEIVIRQSPETAAARCRDHAETVIRQSPETAAARCRDHTETVSRQSLAISGGRVRRNHAIPAAHICRMTPQRTPTAPVKALITAEFPILK